MASLSGKSAIVTGASRGIGAAIARALAAEGAAVMLLARGREAVETLAAELRTGGAQVQAMACDVADFAQVQAVANAAQIAFGRIDILVNNAAVIEPIGSLSSSDPAAWARAIDINVKGVYHGMRAVLPGMRAQGSGIIVNIGSGAAHNPMEGWSHYCSSKAATAMLTRCAHLENKGRGIRIFSLSPGTVATDMQRKIRASGINPVSQMEFSAHAPVEVPARAVVWLCGPVAAEHAGQEISLRDPAMRARIGLD
jgi:NAD(P)-dependent dehydrogenase (short-subunit alcohol dehydrogenase family)